MSNILLVTLVALVLAYFLSEVFRHFKLPRVIGQILAGIILGFPIIKSSLFTDETTPIFSFATNIGIILLFFFLYLYLERLLSMLKYQVYTLRIPCLFLF